METIPKISSEDAKKEFAQFVEEESTKIPSESFEDQYETYLVSETPKEVIRELKKNSILSEKWGSLEDELEETMVEQATRKLLEDYMQLINDQEKNIHKEILKVGVNKICFIAKSVWEKANRIIDNHFDNVAEQQDIRRLNYKFNKRYLKLTAELERAKLKLEDVEKYIDNEEPSITPKKIGFAKDIAEQIAQYISMLREELANLDMTKAQEFTRITRSKDGVKRIEELKKRYPRYFDFDLSSAPTFINKPTIFEGYPTKKHDLWEIKSQAMREQELNDALIKIVNDVGFSDHELNQLPRLSDFSHDNVRIIIKAIEYKLTEIRTKGEQKTAIIENLSELVSDAKVKLEILELLSLNENKKIIEEAEKRYGAEVARDLIKNRNNK